MTLHILSHFSAGFEQQKGRPAGAGTLAMTGDAVTGEASAGETVGEFKSELEQLLQAKK